MLCKTKAKRKWEEHNTRKQVGKENTEALPMGATEERSVIGMSFPTRF